MRVGVNLQCMGKVFGARRRQLMAGAYHDASSCLKTVLQGFFSEDQVHSPLAHELVKSSQGKKQFDRLKDQLDSFGNSFDGVELTLTFCDDSVICELNEEWRGEKKATDVLTLPSLAFGEIQVEHLSSQLAGFCDDPHASFNPSDVAGLEAFLKEFPLLDKDENSENCESQVGEVGEMVISLDTAERQAAERGIATEDELRILLVHGMLHLVGFDHERSENDFRIMANAETLVMRQLGWRGAGLCEIAQ